MVFIDEVTVLIKCLRKSLQTGQTRHKLRHCAKRLLKLFPVTNIGYLYGTLVYYRNESGKSIQQAVRSADRCPGSGRPHTAHANKKIDEIQELALSQEEN